MPALDELLDWARTTGVAVVEHPDGWVQVPGGGPAMTWAELAAAFVLPPSALGAPVSLSKLVRAYNDDLGLKLSSYAFTAAHWTDSSITFVRESRPLTTMRGNDPEMLTEVLKVLKELST